MAFRLLDLRSADRRPSSLKTGENLVGSHPACEIVIDDPSVSRHHAVVVVSPDRIEIADLGSENGTRVNGKRIRSKIGLQPGDEVLFGTATFELSTLDDEDAEIVISLPGQASDMRETAPPSTASIAPLHRFTVEHLSRILAALETENHVGQAALVGEALVRCLPTLRVEIRWCEAGRETVLFRAVPTDERGPRVLLGGSNTGADVVVEAEFLHSGAERFHRPLLEISLQLLRLGRRMGAYTSSSRVDPSEAALEDDAWPRPRTRDEVLESIYEKASVIAGGKIPILILGESGTGKELLARFVHRASRVASGPFVTLNCAAIPRDLQEAELFGIESGVATGVTSRAGSFELAHAGTLFLDEIGDMALATQAKILRVLQDGEVTRLGGAKARPAGFRLISATHQDVKRMRAGGEFRDDLYHRISDWEVTLPPLRKRRIDIANLAAHFLAKEAESQGKRILGISRKALRVLENHQWPGNVRELEREIARTSLFVADGGVLDSELLSPEILAATAGGKPETLKELLQRTEREAFREAWIRAGEDVNQVSTALDVPVSTVYRKLKTFGLRPD